MGFAVSGMVCFILFAGRVLPNDAYWPTIFAALLPCRMGVIGPGDSLQTKIKRTGREPERVASNG